MKRVKCQVFEETDYNVFKKMKSNRMVTEQRVQNIMESLSKKNIMNPIVVNENMEILEGQGRFEAKKRLGLPIWYVVEKGGDINDCTLMNQFNKPWSSDDFVNRYAEDGNENYIRLWDVRQDTKIGYTLLLSLAGHGDRGRSGSLKSGNLVFTSVEETAVYTILNCVNEYKSALSHTGRLNTTFYKAVKVVIAFPGYDHAHMLKNLSIRRTSFVVTRALGDQLKEFTAVYNYGVRKAGKKLYFEDYLRNKGLNVRSYEALQIGGAVRERMAGEKDVSTLSAV